VRKTIRVFCGISFLKQEYNGGFSDQFAFYGSQKRLKTLLDKCTGSEKILGTLNSIPADARFIMHNLLADLNRSSPAYYAGPIGPYVSGASEEWQFTAIMQFVYRDESMSRDSDHDRSWLLILKQKLRVMSGQPHPRAVFSGFHSRCSQRFKTN
jgi:hypothetical protein